jgi:hypothetical protein
MTSSSVGRGQGLRRCHPAQMLASAAEALDGQGKGQLRTWKEACPTVRLEPERGDTSYGDLPVLGRTEHSYWVLCRAHSVWNLLGVGAYQGESSGGGTDYETQRYRKHWGEQDGAYHLWHRPPGYGDLNNELEYDPTQSARRVRCLAGFVL